MKQNSRPTLSVIRNIISILSVAVIAILSLTACSDDDDKSSAKALTEKTLFVYLPWSGNSNALTSYFRKNISDIKEAIDKRGLKNERVVVFFSTSGTKATMFELVPTDTTCAEVLLKEYTSPALNTKEGITNMFTDLKTFAPAVKYAMTIGAHGKGWVTAEARYPQSSSSKHFDLNGEGGSYTENDWDDYSFIENGEHRMVRSFGGSRYEYVTNVTTFANGIAAAEMKMEFILFDVCYMGSVEVVYDLRNVADYIIASPAEIMDVGMPYTKIVDDLLTTNYDNITTDFYDFYSSYSLPYGTISITDCSQLDTLASIMREINASYEFDQNLLTSLQKFDGESNPLFLDLGDYVEKLCPDEALLARFKEQMDKVVPYYIHTEEYPYSSFGRLEHNKINTYSGLTTSAPSNNHYATGVIDTNWHKDTH